MWATDKDNLEMVELLLANNADPNIKAKVQYMTVYTLKHLWSVTYYNIILTPMYNSQLQNNWTALMLATRQGNLKIVKTLLDHGADPNAQTSVCKNYTVSHNAFFP